MSGAVVDRIEGRDAIQRGLDKSGKCAQGNLMRFKIDKYKVLHLVGTIPDPGTEWEKSSLRAAL